MEQYAKDSNLWDNIDNDRLKLEFISYNRTLEQI